MLELTSRCQLDRQSRSQSDESCRTPRLGSVDQHKDGQIHRAQRKDELILFISYNSGIESMLIPYTGAGGSWLSNGTMVSIGGNPRVNAASYYDANVREHYC